MAAAARIGVVALDEAAGDAVGEGGELRQRAVRGADDGARRAAAGAHRDRPRDPHRLLVEGRDRAADGVDDPPLAVVHHLGRQIGEVEPAGEFGDALGAVVHCGDRDWAGP